MSVNQDFIDTFSPLLNAGDLNSPFGKESIFYVLADLSGVSTHPEAFTHKVFFLKGTEVLQRYQSDIPQDNELLVFYEEGKGVNFFGTVCRVKMGAGRKAMMQALQQGKRRVTVNKDGRETTSIDQWANRIAAHHKGIDAGILYGAVQLELSGKEDKDSLFKTLFSWNNLLAELLDAGVAGMEKWKLTRDNYEYSKDNYRPIIPVTLYHRANDFFSTGNIEQETIKNTGMAQLSLLADKLEEVMLRMVRQQLITKPLLATALPIATVTLREQAEKLLPPGVKQLLDKIKSLLADTRTFITEIAQLQTDMLATLNAFLCGVVNGVISLLQTVLALLSMILGNIPQFELEKLTKENAAGREYYLELAEDLTDLIAKNLHLLFDGLKKAAKDLARELPKLIKELAQTLRGYSHYFWAYFAGMVLFEVALEILLAYLTGGISAAAKTASKISRASQQISQPLRKGMVKTTDKATLLLQYLQKELDKLIKAITEGRFFEWLREQLFKLFGIGKKAELRLRGEVIVLKGFKWEKIRYVKRPRQQYNRLLKESRKAKQDFIEDMMKKPFIKEKLKKSGISDEMIERMRTEKRPPDGWQVHHKLPLDDGGVNDFKNLMLIQDEPYHKSITVYQNSFAKNLNELEVIEIEFPIFNGFMYP